VFCWHTLQLFSQDEYERAIIIKPAAYINFLFIQIILKTKIQKLFSYYNRFDAKWLQMQINKEIDASNF